MDTTEELTQRCDSLGAQLAAKDKQLAAKDAIIKSQTECASLAQRAYEAVIRNLEEKLLVSEQ
jgi:hypothetical protein